MSKYRFFVLKRYFEQVLMWPFILLGRFVALFTKRMNFDIYFFIPIYGLGGAEYVNAKILEALPDQNILLVFTKKSTDNTALKLFRHPNVTIKDCSKWTDNKFIYWANFIARGFFAQSIKRNHHQAKVFIGQCNFAYKLTPHLSRQITVIELIHLFDERFCNVWMPFVSFLDKRMCVAAAEIEKINAYADNVGIPLKYKQRFSELRLFVDIPESILPEKGNKPTLKVYYAGRGTAQKRLWLHFEIARRIKALKLPISFYYVGNFQDELPNDISSFASFTPSLSMGNEMYQFIKDKDVLLLSSHSEGFPIALLEAMHFGIVPVVTPVGGMPTAVHHMNSGILLENGDEEEVISSAVAALKLLSEDTILFQKLSANIRRIYLDQFSKAQFNNLIRREFDLPS